MASTSFEIYPPAIQNPEASVIKHEFSYSFASIVANLATMTVSGSFWIRLVLESLETFHNNGFSTQPLSQMLIALLAIAGIGYMFLRPRFLNATSIPIYGSESISNQAMCNNIVEGFHQRKKHTSLLARVKNNLYTPSLTPDLIETFNEVLIMNYETYGKIFVRLDKTDDTLASIQHSVRQTESSMTTVLGRTARTEVSIGHIQNQLSKIETHVAKTETTLDEMKLQSNYLEERFDRVEAKVDRVEDQFVKFREESSNRFDKLEAKVDKLEAKVDRVEDQFVKFRAESSNRFDKLEAKVDKLEAKVDKLEAKFDRLEAKFDRLESNVADIKAMMEKFTFVVA